MAYKAYSKKELKRSASVVGISLIALLIALTLIIGNIKKEVKEKVVLSGDFVATKMIDKMKETGIVKEMVPVVSAAVATTEAAVEAAPVDNMDPFAATVETTAVTTEAAVEMKEVEVFKPDVQYFFVNNLEENFGAAPKDKNVSYDN